jgi:drug/metabolite transporter (DMT)-like permease
VIIFALTAAVLYGGADFLGGMAARRANPIAVTSLTLPAGALILLLVMLAGRGVPGLSTLVTIGGGWDAMAWAITGGIVGAVGLTAFYRGFATAAMSVVAPVSALVSTVLPVGVALAGGERPTVLVVAGALTCLVAIVLVSAESSSGRGQKGAEAGEAGEAAAASESRSRRLRGLGYGIAAGAAFGMFFVCLKYASHDAVLWPVLVQRLAGSGLAFAMLAATRTRPPWRGGADRGLLRIALASGAGDAAANVCYVLATRAGQFGLAVVITSLYPGMTVLLARLVLGERMRMVQRIGLLLAAAGIVLVTALARRTI